MLCLLKDEMKDSKYVNLAYRSAILMLNLINDMLDFSAILKGRFDKRASLVNIHELASEAKEKADPKNKTSENIRFESIISKDIPKGTTYPMTLLVIITDKDCARDGEQAI